MRGSSELLTNERKALRTMWYDSMKVSIRVLLFAAALSLGALAAAAQTIGQEAQGKPTTVSFRVTRFGVEPPRVVIPPGPVILLVHNNVNMSGLQLNVQRSLVETIAQAKNPNGGLRLRQKFTVTEGTYVLQDPKRPKWQAVLVVKGEKR